MKPQVLLFTESWLIQRLRGLCDQVWASLICACQGDFILDYLNECIFHSYIRHIEKKYLLQLLFNADFSGVMLMNLCTRANRQTALVVIIMCYYRKGCSLTEWPRNCRVDITLLLSQQCLLEPLNLCQQGFPPPSAETLWQMIDEVPGIWNTLFWPF